MTDTEDKNEETKPEATKGAEAEVEAKKEPVAKEAKAADKETKSEAKEAKAAEPKAKAEKAEAKAEEPKAKAAPRKKARKKAAEKPSIKVPEIKALGEKEVKLSPAVFAIEPKVGVLHEAVRAELAARRSGTASTKKRGEVSGGGAKPWRQKGTGRARAGSSRMPHWTGGGIAFGPKPRDYGFKVNRKVRAKALKMALSARASEGGIKVIDGLPFDEPKTAAAAAVLANLDLNYPLLVLVGEDDGNAAMSFRNLPQVTVVSAGELGVADIMATRSVLLTKHVLDQLNSLGGSK
ncbi:MAG: 50S ribosomal protein L4 [Actinobacteria bacterium]|nr:50S ribosomal protein L4 [Actinomycetota bacterium]